MPSFGIERLPYIVILTQGKSVLFYIYLDHSSKKNCFAMPLSTTSQPLKRTPVKFRFRNYHSFSVVTVLPKVPSVILILV